MSKVWPRGQTWHLERSYSALSLSFLLYFCGLQFQCEITFYQVIVDLEALMMSLFCFSQYKAVHLARYFKSIFC